MLQAVMTTSMPPAAAAPNADDRRLAARCAAGDSLIFEEIYRHYGERMKSIAWNHLGSIADAEDAVQETFLKIHRAASTYTGEALSSAFAEGKRARGLSLLGEVMQHCSERFSQMQKEARTNERRNASSNGHDASGR